MTRYIKSDLVNQSDAGERKESSMGLVDKAKDFLQSDQAEEKSDQVLDKAEELAKKALGDEKAPQIASVRDAIDAKIGNEGKK